jgi:hypothetical protein
MPAMADNRVAPKGGAMPRLDDAAGRGGACSTCPVGSGGGNQIIKIFRRENFAHVTVFVNEVAAAAEAAGHHPDIRWNVALSSAPFPYSTRRWRQGAQVA